MKQIVLPSAALVLALLSGCRGASSPDPSVGIDHDAKSWDGYPTDQLVATWGMPSERTSSAQGADVLTYRSEVVAERGAPSKSSCQVSFYASKETRTIQSSAWSGPPGACAELVKANPLESARIDPTERAKTAPEPPAPGGVSPTGRWLQLGFTCVDATGERPTEATRALSDPFRTLHVSHALDFDTETYELATSSCGEQGKFRATRDGDRPMLELSKSVGRQCPSGLHAGARYLEIRGDVLYAYEAGDPARVCGGKALAQKFRRVAKARD